MKLLVTVGLGLSLVAASSAAAAFDNPKGFGEKSQLILSADRLVPLFSFSRSSVTATQNGVDLTSSTTGTGISLLWGRDQSNSGLLTAVNPHSLPRVGFDFTVIQNLTVGGSIAFGFGLGGTQEVESVNGATVVTRSSDAPTGTAIGLAPRVGYVLGLNDWLAFWPRLGFAFYSISSKTEELDNNVTTTRSTTYTQFSLDLDPQLTFVPFEHFFFHVGPLLSIPFAGTLSTETSRGATTTTVDVDAATLHFGISAGLGGYFTL